MITHHSLPADSDLPQYLRRSSCGKVMCRVAYDPERDHNHMHVHANGGTPYGSGSSNWAHVNCGECRAKMRHWFVVGLERDGTELARVTVKEDGVDRASDWVEVVDPEGKIAPRMAWPRDVS